MPDLLWDSEPEQTFRITTDEAVVYCYIRRLSDYSDARGRFDRDIGSTEAEASGEMTSSDEPDSVWIVGLLPEDSMENVMGSVVRLACIGLPFIVLLAALGGWAIAGRSLRPLRKITQSAREISDGHDLSRRIELDPGRDEVHELADTFNGMMSRLERSFEAERQFTSDASHELRTPTTVILAECEMAEKTPEDAEAVQESVAEIHKQARKMSDLIGKLLSYTRLEQGTRKIDRERLDLGAGGGHLRGAADRGPTEHHRRLRVGTGGVRGGRRGAPHQPRAEPRHQRREIRPGRRARDRTGI